MTRRPISLPLLVALVLGALGWAGSTSTAYAGGPTSVLVVSPGREQARAAYYRDPVYDTLTTAVGEGHAGPAEAPAGTAEGGEDVRLTWLIHDVQIWRIDRIHLTGPDGVWIETVADLTGDGRLSAGRAHWHRPADPAALTAALAEVGLLADAGAAPTGPPPAGGEVAAEAAVPAPGTRTPGLVVAALGGLVLGVAATLVGGRARNRARAGRGPRVSLTG